MLYIDFDGTIVDVWKRYYRVFTNASGLLDISLEDFIQVKRREQADSRVAAYFSAKLAPDYWIKKRQMLENPEYLKLDELLLPADELLSFFASHSCRILTARRNPHAFYDQLKWLGIFALNTKSIILDPDGNVRKRDYISQHSGYEKNWIVGDSRAEAEAAEIPGTQVILVKTGLQDVKTLNVLGTCEIVNNLLELIQQYKEIN